LADSPRGRLEPPDPLRDPSGSGPLAGPVRRRGPSAASFVGKPRAKWPGSRSGTYRRLSRPRRPRQHPGPPQGWSSVAGRRSERVPGGGDLLVQSGHVGIREVDVGRDGRGHGAVVGAQAANQDLASGTPSLSRSLPGAMVASTAGSLSLASLLFSQLGGYGVHDSVEDVGQMNCGCLGAR
jgi:hypothetical protein